jgi:hypothetical protein
MRGGGGLKETAITIILQKKTQQERNETTTDEILTDAIGGLLNSRRHNPIVTLSKSGVSYCYKLGIDNANSSDPTYNLIVYRQNEPDIQEVIHTIKKSELEL